MANGFNLDVAISATIGNLDQQMRRAGQAVRDFGAQAAQAGRDLAAGVGSMSSEISTMTDEITTAASEQEDAFNQAGQALVAFGGAVGAGLGFAAKAAADWESAWAGVVKTTDATEEELPALESALRGLTEVLPATHAEIAAVAEAAGQLGVRSKDVVGFTKTMIDLGESTNLSSDEAATSLAQISNIMGTMEREGVPGIERLGSTLVALGNAGASTEADIVQLALRLAGAGKVIGLSEANVFALANGMASLGINAEAGGSAMSRVMSLLHSAVAVGGNDLNNFAAVAGLSADQFATAFRETPAEAIVAFTQGLGRINEEGGNVYQTFGDLGIISVEMRDVLLRLAGGGDLLAESVRLGNDAWRENTALVEEAEKRYETTESRIAIARNQLTELGIEIGGVLLPALASLADGFAGLLSFLSDLPDPVMNATVLIGGTVAAVSLLSGGLLLLLPQIVATKAAFVTLGNSMPTTMRNLGLLGRAGIVGLAAAGLALLTGNLADLIDKNDPAAKSVGETTKAILAMKTAADAGALVAFSYQMDDLGKKTMGAVPGVQAGAKGMYDINDALEDLTGNTLNAKAARWGQSLDKMFGTNVQRYQNASREQFENIGKSLASLVEGGHLDMARQGFDTLYASVDQTRFSTEDLMSQLGPYGDALAAVETESALAKESGDALALSLDEQAAAVGMSSEAYEEAANAIRETREAWDEAARGFITINDTYTGMLEAQRAAQEETARHTAEHKGEEGDAWEKYVGEVSVSLDAYLAELQRQEQAQLAWRDNMLGLVGRVSQGTIDYLARLGPEGAPLVQALVDGTDAQLQEFDRLTNLTMAGATTGWITEMERAGALITAVAGASGQAAADELGRKIAAGEITVEAAAKELGASIRENVPGQWTVVFDADTSRADAAIARINRNIRATVGPLATTMMYHGGILKPMADGGVLSPMAPVAQMVSPNTWRVVGDRMDVPEAYIPLDDSARSREIFEQTAAALGYYARPITSGDVRMYASGAMLGGRPSAPVTTLEPIDPAALADALNGIGLVIEVEGRPISGIVRTELKAQGRAAASGSRI